MNMMPRRYSGTERFNVEYLGGHTSYPKETRGTIYVKEDYVSFESSDGKVEFGFSIEKIKQARIRKTKRSNWARAWAIGPLAVFFPEKYVQIIYEEKDGGVQTVDFDFLEDAHDFRKNVFMELLPSTVKMEVNT